MNPFSSLIYQSDINDIFPDKKSDNDSTSTSDHLLNISFNINNNLISSYTATKKKDSGKIFFFY